MRLASSLLGVLLATQLPATAGLDPRLLAIDKERNKARTGKSEASRDTVHNWVSWYGSQGPAGKLGNSRWQVVNKEPKYFHEPSIKGGGGGHYDKRYFRKVVPEAERQKALRHLIHAWLGWTKKQNVETWLAHGTLLGWWWNAEILPWDTDLDVQISEATLKNLAENHNMTRWTYDFEDGDHKEYLLDINSYWTDRLRSSTSNLIDGRWVDTSTGLFIDITGLSETHPEGRPGIISCKNMHHYHVNEIWPLRPAQFENVQAFVPYQFDRVLIKEYRSKAFTLTEYDKYEWQPALKSWVKKQTLQPRKVVTLRNGKTMKIKQDEPRGLEAVPKPTLMQNLERLLHYWQ
ncbi:hypothetical protein Dda_3002 [Drechslerella dactyloides]|uniref:LicD/FKTN/FKRP nucleotidyltransferase domain-containing protein n=1 Tax=Drechslerella dactyloides TaxID=74499 RepID=A0AAD6J501_DREDA|nr:hypothetical protein Dda_3002 [Drechslerella dactyloides]